MAIDNRLQIFDENGNLVDYDIMATDVKFADGKDLPTKLDELEDEIGESQGGYTPPPGGIPKTDLAPAVQQTLDDVANKVDKVTGKGLSTNDYTTSEKQKLAGLQNYDDTALSAAITSLQNALNALVNGGSVTDAIDTFNEVKDFLNGIDTDDPTLFNQLKSLSDAITALNTALSGKVDTSTTVNGKPLSGNVTIGMSDIQGLVNAIAQAGGQVTVTTNGDGTFTIHAADDYTINLNHTHENMAKLVVCEESDLPSTLDMDTIYGVNEDGEIAVIYLGGLPFYGGGGAAPGTPRLTSPSQSQINNGINIGNTTSGVATYSLNIKAKDLTQSLLVQWGSGSTGYSFDTSNLPTGVTYDSGTGKLTITKEAACEINGVNIPVVYTGNDTDEDAEGTIGISSSSVDGINVAVTLVANKVTYEDLAGVKLTGTQWLQTDYKPNANTEFRLTCRFEQRSDTQSISKDNYEGNIFSVTAGQSDKWFYLRNMAAVSGNIYNPWNLMFVNESSSSYNGGTQIIQLGESSTTRPYLLVDPVEISYTKGSTEGTIGFTDGTHTLTKPTSLKSSTQENAMMIGRTYNASNSKDMIYSMWNLTIYSFVITENRNEVRHWVPKLKNGTIPGLYDTVTGTFISSETSTELVAVPLT